MKRALVVVVIGIIFLLILAAVLWKAFGSVSTPPASTTTFPTSPTATVPTQLSPDQFAVAFYTWYLANYGTVTTHDQVGESLGNWLTPSFASQVPTIISNTGADPFFLAQDAPPLDSKITASVVNQSSAASDVRVTITASVGTISYLVHLVMVDGNWHLDSVSQAS